MTAQMLAASGLWRRRKALAVLRASQLTRKLDEVPSGSVRAVELALPKGRSRKMVQQYLAKWRTQRPITTGTDLGRRGIAAGPGVSEDLAAPEGGVDRRHDPECRGGAAGPRIIAQEVAVAAPDRGWSAQECRGENAADPVHPEHRIPNSGNAAAVLGSVPLSGTSSSVVAHQLRSVPLADRQSVLLEPVRQSSLSEGWRRRDEETGH